MTNKRFFVDMDGVLAKFNFWLLFYGLLYWKFYFLTRPPHRRIVKAIRQMVVEGYDVYILSAVLEKAKFAKSDKHTWLDIFLKILGREKRIFTVCGQNKLDFIPDFNPETDILIDDYGVNCQAWAEAGGTYVKVARNRKDAIYEAQKHEYVIHPQMKPAEIRDYLLAVK